MLAFSLDDDHSVARLMRGFILHDEIGADAMPTVALNSDNSESKRVGDNQNVP